MAYHAHGHASYAPYTCASRLGCHTVYLARRLLSLGRPRKYRGQKILVGPTRSRSKTDRTMTEKTMMSKPTQEATTPTKSKAWMFLVAAFIALVVIGILTT